MLRAYPPLREVHGEARRRAHSLRRHYPVRFSGRPEALSAGRRGPAPAERIPLVQRMKGAGGVKQGRHPSARGCGFVALASPSSAPRSSDRSARASRSGRRAPCAGCSAAGATARCPRGGRTAGSPAPPCRGTPPVACTAGTPAGPARATPLRATAPTRGRRAGGGPPRRRARWPPARHRRARSRRC